MWEILQLCARDTGHGQMAQALAEASNSFQKEQGCWHTLITTAEQHGMASLLYRHLKELEVDIPKESRRLLQSLYLRNRRASVTRNKGVLEVVQAYDAAGIDLLLVKGIALSNFVYSEIGLRPMRDIDLLVRKSDLQRAQEILFELGYAPAEDHAVPDDYYHLTPMEKVIDGLPVSIELHHNLLPFHPQYPLWPLDKSFATAKVIGVDGVKVKTLSLTDTLHYVYLHGFQAPLTYEPYRLMHVGDIVSLVERFVDEMDWAKVSREVPTLCNAISRFHYLTPWSESVQQKLAFSLKPRPKGVGKPFAGWPLYKIKDTSWSGLPTLIQETLFPPEWWLQLYYGQLKGIGYWRVRYFIYPRTLWRWVKSYLYYWKRKKGG